MLLETLIFVLAISDNVQHMPQTSITFNAKIPRKNKKNKGNEKKETYEEIPNSSLRSIPLGFLVIPFS